MRLIYLNVNADLKKCIFVEIFVDEGTIAVSQNKDDPLCLFQLKFCL